MEDFCSGFQLRRQTTTSAHSSELMLMPRRSERFRLVRQHVPKTEPTIQAHPVGRTRRFPIAAQRADVNSATAIPLFK